VRLRRVLEVAIQHVSLVFRRVGAGGGQLGGARGQRPLRRQRRRRGGRGDVGRHVPGGGDGGREGVVRRREAAGDGVAVFS